MLYPKLVDNYASFLKDIFRGLRGRYFQKTYMYTYFHEDALIRKDLQVNYLHLF